jgi:RsiW-degrading membrane proteinase PrsW (M82 family)
MVFDTKSLSEVQFRRAVLAAFAIAGLGFGAGEALKYFGTYAKEDAGAFWYGVRAVWCVTLHGAWTLIVGAMLSTSLPQDPKLLENKKADTFFMLLLASVPTAIAHGLYNTCCKQGEILPWIVGGLSLFVAFEVVEAFLEEKQEEPKPEQQPS